MQSDILRFTESPLTNDSIERYEWHEYEPATRSNLNSAGEIRINIEQQDLFSHPSESYLLIEGRLTKTNGNAYANADAVAITNNGLMHLFSQISYSLSNQDIETVFHPGQATTMLGLLKYPNDYAVAQGLKQLWAKDTTATAVIAITRVSRSDRRISFRSQPQRAHSALSCLRNTLSSSARITIK